MKLIEWAQLVSITGVGIAALSACGAAAGSSAPSSTASTPVVAIAPADLSPKAAACWYFNRFYSDLTTMGPHAVGQLRADLGDAQHGDLATTAAASGDSSLDYAAANLVAYVGSSKWMSEGNLMSAPVARLHALCP